MMITRDNYEVFFLDYLEGNLDERLIDQFLDFLEKNPDLKEELHLFENIQLPPEKAVFKGKDTLYKPVLAENESFELKAVAYMEGDLKDKERLAFTATLDRNPALQKEYSLFEKTRLVADTAIQYPRKNKLYRKAGAVIWLNWSVKVAAILMLFLGIYSLLQNGEDRIGSKMTNEVAEVKEPAESPKKAVVGGKEMIDTRQETGDTRRETGEERLKTAGNEKEIVEIPEQSVEKVVKEREAMASNTVPSNSAESIPSTEENKGLENAPEQVREPMSVERIEPLMARLEEEPELLALAVSHSINTEKINDPGNVMTLDEYLALRAKKATNEGVLSFHRLIRAGLNVASELSGDRLGYTVKNGKVASLDFESKLLAFELPLEKK